MKNYSNIFMGVIAGLILNCNYAANAQYLPRLDFNAKHEPADKIIHGAGQSNMIEFSSYASAMGNDIYPSIYMFYTTANRTVAQQEERVGDNLALLANHPDGIMPQIGLSFTRRGTHYAEDVIAGVYDDGLNRLAELLNDFGDPVFVRIGYEANGSWNNYEASSYINAFRYITDILRATAPNVATVWCTHPITSLSDMMTYYPGDSYVDWWSIDLFEIKFLNSANTQDFLDEAVNHSKPVIIGESTPAKVGTRNGIDSWNDWFVPYFNIIEDNPVIKAICYINRNWLPTGLSDWLDCRVIMDTVVLTNYKNELAKPIYQHATVDQNFRITAVKPSNDAYVRDGTYSNTIYGVSDPNRLRIKNSQVAGYSREAYLYYDLAGIENITASNLWLFGRNSSDVDIIAELHQVNDHNWDETTLTWNNKPAKGNLIGEVFFDDGDDEWTYLNVSNHMINGNFNQAGFALKNKLTDENQIKVDSKEKDDGDIPFLIIFHSVSANSGINQQLNQSTDDAEEGGSSVDLTSGDLDFGDKPYNGLRFQNVAIEQGASITNAYIQFTADDNNQSASASYTVYGEDVDNASTFTTSSNNISGRTNTSASVAWNNIPAWNTAGETGDNQKTPDLSTIVQEIVDRGGWSSGNAMAFFINGSSGKRSARTYDADPAKAAQLVIEYTTGGRRFNSEESVEEQLVVAETVLPAIYPNPATNVLTINVSDNSEMIIYNLSGKIMKSEVIKANQNQVNISDLPVGFYLIKIGNKTYKLIKE